MADFVCGCMILHDLFAEMVHQCSRLVGRWVIPQKSPNGSRVPNVPMAAAGSVHLEFVALAEPHLWLCQSQFGGSWTHQDDSQHAVARRKLLGQFLGVFFGVSTMVGLITPWPDQSGYRSQNAWAIVHECVPAPCSIIFPHHPKLLQSPREMKTTLDLIKKDLEKQAELRAGHKPADDSEAEDDMSWGPTPGGVLIRKYHIPSGNLT